jgi:hypothetical protein
MIAKEARQQVALDRYLAENPQLAAEIQPLSAHEQAQQVLWAFEDEAEHCGLDTWELIVQMVAQTPEELHAMRLEVHQEVAEALGMQWDDYRELNELDEFAGENAPAPSNHL